MYCHSELEIGDRPTTDYKSFRIGSPRQKRLDKSLIKGVSRETVRPPKASELSVDMFWVSYLSKTYCVNNMFMFKVLPKLKIEPSYILEWDLW